MDEEGEGNERISGSTRSLQAKVDESEAGGTSSTGRYSSKLRCEDCNHDAGQQRLAFEEAIAGESGEPCDP